MNNVYNQMIEQGRRIVLSATNFDLNDQSFYERVFNKLKISLQN